MPTLTEAKARAKRLQAALANQDIDLPHSAVLDLIADELGFKDWNTAAANLQDDSNPDIRLLRAIPILRIFDEHKAREFYCGFLGFTVEFEHRFEPDLPIYMGIIRAGLTLHLSEHHGDASPGSTVFVPMQNIHAFHTDLITQNYGYGRPGIRKEPWGDLIEVHDPFGNRIRFCQQNT